MNVQDSSNYVYPGSESLDNETEIENSLAEIKSTSIGTIVVRGGPVQMVIALLKSPNDFHIKVVELEPKLTALGENIDEAISLQKEHDDVLKQLHGMSTPIEEFFKKAEKLLASKKINLNVLDAMENTLNVIWDDVLKLLHSRKHLLDLCANFHEEMGNCRGKMASLEVACKDTMIPIEVDAVQEFLNKFKQLRIDVLTSVMSALKEGNELLTQLKELTKLTTLDSRSGHIKRSAMCAEGQVQRWLENLHDRRNLLETAWRTRKGQLEQCLILAILTKDLHELESQLMNQKNNLSDVFSLGECEHTANATLLEYNGLKHDALLFRDRALKITRATEKLVSTGNFVDNEACSRTYNTLSKCTEFLELIDQRIQHLQQSKEFFAKADKTLSVFERLEIELSSVKSSSKTSEVFSLSKILKDSKDFAEESLYLGYNLLNEFSPTNSEICGIKRVVEEIENRKVYIEEICSANTETQMKMVENLNNFLEQYNRLLSWLVSTAKSFLKTNNILGTNLQEAKNFLHLHHQLMQDLKVKGENINDLLSSIKNCLQSLDAQQRYDIDTKAESLHKHWIELKEIVLRRFDLGNIFIEFLEKSKNLNTLFDKIEQILNEVRHGGKLCILEDNWSEIKNSYGNLKATGIRFLNIKVVDPYLETKNACSSVEEILNNFSKRQFDITSIWENLTTSLKEKQEIEINLEKIMMKNIEVINQDTALDTKLYPIFLSTSEDPIKLKGEIKETHYQTLKDMENLQEKIIQQIENTSSVETKDINLSRKIEQVKINLTANKNKLDYNKRDYQLLLEDISHFLDDIITLRKSIDQNFMEKKNSNILSFENLTQIISEHDHFYENSMDKFRTLISQSQKIIDLIRVLEPENVRECDIDRILKLLENLRNHFDLANENKMTEMKKLQFDIKFESELSDVNNNLINLDKQLNEIREQNLETLSSAKTSSLAFEYFERTIELLENRIENFIKSENTSVTNSQKGEHIHNELGKLKTKWDHFKNQVKLIRKTLNLTINYFELLEKIDSKYKEANAFYNNIANKISFLQDSVEASNLVNDIEKYITTNEYFQLKNIENLLSLSQEINKREKSFVVKSNNLELFKSFLKLKSDINLIEEHLRNKNTQENNENPSQVIDAIDEIHTKTMVNDVFTEIKFIKPQFTKRLQDTIIQEGEKINFVCHVIGYPIPMIEWFKDGISIQNNSDYHTSNLDGDCTLSIDETFTADSARFMCLASNLVGSDETCATLTVKEHTEDDQMTPPKIMTYLKSGTAREGSSFQFSCTVMGNPLPTIQWFKDNNCIDDSPDYVILYNNGEAILRFDQVFLEDHAVYTCKVFNPAGFEQCSAKLNVEPLEPTEIPSFKLLLSNVMARVGQKIKLECAVTGIPRPEIFWMHNGKPMQGREFKYERDRITLIIPEAYLNDAGLYVVAAKNIAGEVSSSCNVSVKGRLPHETSDSEVASDMEPIKPTVQLPLKNVEVFEGEFVRLDCVIIGQPEPEVIWYHNDRPVKESSDIQLLFQGDRCSLIIQETYLEDDGSYKVIAINSAGETSSTCTLSVTPLNIAEPAKRQQHEKSLILPPKFEKYLSDASTIVGNTVKLECSVIGDEPFTVKWYHNDEELSVTDRIKIISESGGIFKLIINNVANHDMGVYTVEISNKFGSVKCFSRLIVECVIAPNTKFPHFEDEEKLICPTFRKLFFDQSVSSGENVEFECVVTGKPTPKIKWFFNDRPICNENFLIYNNGDRQVLLIQSASLETRGKIGCLAENEIGKATCIAYLNVNDGNVKPPLSFFQVQSKSEEHNNESSRVIIKKQILTTDCTSHTSKIENRNSETEISSEILNLEQSVKQKETNISQNINANEDDIQVHQKPVEPVCDLQKIETSIKSSRRPTAPQFISPLTGVVIDQGTNVLLKASYDAFPSPEIKIQRNGEDIFNSDHITIMHEFSTVSIQLSNADICDAGRYSITASNQIGSCTSTADVVVKKTIIPPVFGRRLQAQVAKRDEKVVMDIEVTGTPTPAVMWFKDNKPLKEALKSDFKIMNQGNIHTLVIEKVSTQDSGKYMVKAINDGGESQSIADFAVLEPTPERMIEVLKTTVYGDLKDFKESFKPAEKSFDSANIKFEIEADKHITSESKVVTEHRCVTEATMRLEHKTNYIDLPTLTYPIKQTSLADRFDQQKLISSKTNASQTVSNEPPKYVLESTQDPTSIIDKTSISKKFAFQYFKKIENESPVQSEVRYTKFDDLKKSEPKMDFAAASKLNEVTQNKIDSDIIHQSNLRPGTPPEILYVPQSQIIKTKKIEESYKHRNEPPNDTVSLLSQLHKQNECSKYSSKETDLITPSISVPKSVSQINMEKLQAKKLSREEIIDEKTLIIAKSHERKPTVKTNDRSLITSELKPYFSSNTEYKNAQSIKETKKIFERKLSEITVNELKSPNLVNQTLPKMESIKPVQTSIINVELKPGTPPEICFAPFPISQSNFSPIETFNHKIEKDVLIKSSNFPSTESSKSSAKFVEEDFQRDYEREYKNFKLNEKGFRSVKPPQPFLNLPKSTEFTPVTSSYFEISQANQDSYKSTILCSTASENSKSSLPGLLTPVHEKDILQSLLTKNISMTTKQVKEESTNVKPMLSISPSKFSRSDVYESDYSSDFDEKISMINKPYRSTDTYVKDYSPDCSTPTDRFLNLSERTQSPRCRVASRSKFELVKTENPIKLQLQPQVFKPKPIPAKFGENISCLYQPHFTTRYYTAISGAPLHLPSIATETRNTIQLNESSETCHRTVNMSQDKQIIHFVNQKDGKEKILKPIPFSPIDAFTSKRRIQSTSTTTPTKFIPGEFRESDYESEVENARIRPLWTPNSSDTDEPKYRHVDPPRPKRAMSLPRSYERIISPLEFDNCTIEMFNRNTPNFSPQCRLRTYHPKCNTQAGWDNVNLNVTSISKYNTFPQKIRTEVKDLSTTFRKKTNQFIDGISENLGATLYRPAFKRAPSEDSNQLQIYRDDSKISQYGTKHIDPNTGLIYFKYDFGYEFGIIFPGEGKRIVNGIRYPSVKQKKSPTNSTCSDGIAIPVRHELSTANSFRNQNGFTSENEFSENKYDFNVKKRFSMPIEINVDELHTNNRKASETKSVPVNDHINRQKRLKNPPVFITPLKDIAVVIGQTARFECIIQSEPNPEIVWLKNNFPLQSSNKYFMEFRNGVCRLIVINACPDDSGVYSCTGTDELGSASTSAQLLVPESRCGLRN